MHLRMKPKNKTMMTYNSSQAAMENTSSLVHEDFHATKVTKTKEGRIKGLEGIRVSQKMATGYMSFFVRK